MKYEFVEFYPYTPMQGKKVEEKLLGTVHIYLIEAGLDIRGIRILKFKNSIFFQLPHFKTFDGEEGRNVVYPLLRFTDNVKHKEFMDFLINSVKPKIMERLKNQSKQNKQKAQKGV